MTERLSPANQQHLLTPAHPPLTMRLNSGGLLREPFQQKITKHFKARNKERRPPPTSGRTVVLVFYRTVG